MTSAPQPEPERPPGLAVQPQVSVVANSGWSEPQDARVGVAERCLEQDLVALLSATSGRPVEIHRPDGGIAGLLSVSGLASPTDLVDRDTLTRAIAASQRRRAIRRGVVARRSHTIEEAIRHGETIVADGIEAVVSTRSHQFHALARYFVGPLSINAYATPPGGRGLGWHADNHWAFAYQYEGSKRWLFGRDLVDDPTRSQDVPQTMADAGDVVEVVMSEGDGLLVPPGVPHVADAGSDGSVHLTQGLPPPWLDREFLAGDGYAKLICSMPALPGAGASGQISIEDPLLRPYGAWVALRPTADGADLAAPGLGLVGDRPRVIALHPVVAQIVDRIVGADGVTFDNVRVVPGRLATAFGFDRRLVQEVCSLLRSLGVVGEPGHLGDQPAA